jgi:FixJ family two-component response regulator
VDDDLYLRRSLSRLLRSAGFAVDDYGSAESFLEAIESSRPDCAVLDIRLGGMSGPHAKQELDRRGLVIPVIFITAFDEEETRTTLAGHPDVRCLRKPFEPQALIDWARTTIVRKLTVE